MTLLEQLPERREYLIDELRSRVGKGDKFIFGESIGYTHGGIAQVIEEAADVTEGILEDLERMIQDPERSQNIQRADGKGLRDPIKVFYFKTNKDRENFFEKFTKGVETLEVVLPKAKRYREGALKNMKEISDKARDLLRKINVEEETLSRKTQEHIRLESLLSSPKLIRGLDENLIAPACENPVVFLYLASNPSRLDHNLKVSLWSVAIANRAGILQKDLRELSIASSLYNVADFWAAIKNVDRSSDAYRLRDFIVPKKMFITRENSGEKFLDGMTQQEIDTIIHHDSRRDGREIKVGDRSAVYLPESLNTILDGDTELLKKILIYSERKSKGEITIEIIKTSLYHPLFLAQGFINYMEGNKLLLHMMEYCDKVKMESGLNARADFVDAFLGLVEEKYFKKISLQ